MNETATPAAQWNLNGVRIVVNGETAGEAQHDETLGEVVIRFARERGIQNADVSASGRKLSQSQSNQTLGELGVTELTISTKDQRAKCRRWGTHLFQCILTGRVRTSCPNWRV